MAATLKEVETMLDATKFRAMMDEVIVFLSEWLERHLKIVYGNINWNAHIYSMLSPDQQKFATESGASSLDRLDLSALISVFISQCVCDNTNSSAILAKYCLSNSSISFVFDSN